MKQGKLIIFTGPSAVGKATIEKFLFEDPNLSLGFSVSATTRQPRPNEEEGKHYYFMTRENFIAKEINGEFLETSEHFNNKYGTIQSEVDKIISQGKNAFLEVEPNGAIQIIAKKDQIKTKIITIFISPPSLSALEQRIKNRGTETPEQIHSRLARAEEEISHSSIFQYIVINDDPKRAAKEVAQIIIKETQ